MGEEEERESLPPLSLHFTPVSLLYYKAHIHTIELNKQRKKIFILFSLSTPAFLIVCVVFSKRATEEAEAEAEKE